MICWSRATKKEELNKTWKPTNSFAHLFHEILQRALDRGEDKFAWQKLAILLAALVERALEVIIGVGSHGRRHKLFALILGPNPLFAYHTGATTTTINKVLT